MPDVERLNRIAIMGGLGVPKAESWLPLTPEDEQAWDALQREWDSQPPGLAWELPNEMPG